MTSTETIDKRRGVNRFIDVTPIPNFERFERVLDQSSVTELTETVEVLANQTGQLCIEMQQRPIKYNIQLLDLGDIQYRLREPILVVIEEYNGDDTVIASFPEIEVFGEGETETEAIQNLRIAILDLYDELISTSSEILGNLPKTWLNVLQRLIQIN